MTKRGSYRTPFLIYLQVYSQEHSQTHLQFARHLTRQAVPVTVKAKPIASKPIKIEAARLVGSRVIPKSTKENKTVPKIPNKTIVKTVHNSPQDFVLSFNAIAITPTAK